MSAHFMQRILFNFCREYRGIPRFARNDGLEFSSETFEICHAKDRLPLAAKVARREEIEA
jgi:hypothetical protein